MLKNVPGWKLSDGAKGRVCVKSYSGATTTCMNDHVKPAIRASPDFIILHTGTNDLSQEKSPAEIADDIINLAMSVSSSNITTAISGLVPRGDRWRQKGLKVNSLLQTRCNERNIGFIDNSNINAKSHLNGSKLHLNNNGCKLFTKNFSKFLTKYDF